MIRKRKFLVVLHKQSVITFKSKLILRNLLAGYERRRHLALLVYQKKVSHEVKTHALVVKIFAAPARLIYKRWSQLELRVVPHMRLQDTMQIPAPARSGIGPV